MTTAAERVKHELAALPPQDQLALAEFLWERIESVPDSQWDRAWADEAQRRWDSAERGESRYLSREESMREMDKRLERLP